MENVKVYCREKCCGEASFRSDGERMEIRVTMDDPGDGLYRAALRGERGCLTLGVLEAKDGRLSLCRRPYRREVEMLGRVRCVETVCSFPFRKQECWEMTRHPADLQISQTIRERLDGIDRAWVRREGERLVLALEIREGDPFPLEMLFCLGRVRTVGGQRCVVYEFDAQGTPLQAKSVEKGRKTYDI